MSAITTHVLDTSTGRPGAAITVLLEYLAQDGWQEIGTGTTNADGRVSDLLPDDHKLAAGVYRITFDTKAYFAAQSTEGFYPYVGIAFNVKDGSQHYHVPCLLSPFGYSTYRGS